MDKNDEEDRYLQSVQITKRVMIASMKYLGGNVMDQVIARLSGHIEEVPRKWRSYFSESELSERPAPGKWSKKEILGHLCDSAINNQARFIRAQIEELPFTVVGYKQNEWVRLQDYQNASGEEIVQLWVSLNKAIIRVVAVMSGDKYGNECRTVDGHTFTLSWLVEDYVEHLEHHLGRIFS